MWHKLQKDLFSYYSKQKVNGVMGVNGIMRTCIMWITPPICCNDFTISPQKHIMVLIGSVLAKHITKTRLFKYVEKFTFFQKLKIFRYKNSDIFHISAQNMDCGYSLEPPRRGGSNEYPQSILAEITKIMYTPANPSFTI